MAELTARAAADALGLATHEVRLAEAPEGKILEMHVEVPPGQTLGSAHQQVSELEQHVRTSLPDVTDVITHIEPALSRRASGTLPESARINRDVLTLLKHYYPDMDWHHVHTSMYDDGFALTMHVTMPAQIALEYAHGVAEAAEILVRTEFPSVGRVTIHTEPPEGAETPNPQA